MADSNAVKKYIHTVVLQEDQAALIAAATGNRDQRPGNVIKMVAVPHGLGTRWVIVGGRTVDGNPLGLKTLAQDDNLAIVETKDGSPFRNGDTIIVMG